MSISIGSGLNELYVMRTGLKGAISLDGFKTKSDAIAYLVRCSMLDEDADKAKAAIRAVVAEGEVSYEYQVREVVVRTAAGSGKMQRK